MPIIDIEIITKWNNSTKKYYIEKGYKFTKLGDELKVKIEDISENCTVPIKCLCDYCGEITYRTIKDLRKSLIITNKIACKNCKYLKIKETNLNKFGVENPFQSKEIKEKIKDTMIEKYGVENISQSNIIKEQKIETCLKNFNTKFPMQSENVKQKSQTTCKSKYGVKVSIQNKTIKNKAINTMIEKYGVEYSWQSEEIRQKNEKNQFRTLWCRICYSK